LSGRACSASQNQFDVIMLKNVQIKLKFECKDTADCTNLRHDVFNGISRLVRVTTNNPSVIDTFFGRDRLVGSVDTLFEPISMQV